MIQWPMSYEIEYYEKPNGRAPVREFILDLNKKNRKMAARLVQDIDTLQLAGPELGEPHMKYLKSGLYELRSKVGTDITRVFYFFFFGNKIILTNGFVKKTSQTPVTELEKAFRYKKDYEENHDQLR